jgi:2,3-bisphosphoglycerate-independent phosphoglycerate mutase
MQKKLFFLMILDGWGIGEKCGANAVWSAKTPFLDNIMEKYPNTYLKCSGKDVGLPDGIMGNSEVGHMNMGAGRIIFQYLLRINNEIANKNFFQNAVLKSAIKKTADSKSSLHIMGLLSDGGVHSDINHLFALIDMACEKKVQKIFIHPIMDGRDTPPKSGIEYIKALNEYIKDKKNVKIASICGRYFAMDRDKRWERVEKAYDLYTKGVGVKEKSGIEAVENAYNKGETDEFIKPIIITDDDNEPLATIKDNDAIIFFNFRADRAREIASAFTQKAFDGFKREVFPNCDFICMTEYDEKLKNIPVAFPPTHPKNTIGEVISKNGLKQIRIAETEKYAHVTYFFNGGEEKPFLNEDRVLIPSPKEVATYDEKPEMSAHEVKEEVIKRIESNKYDIIVMNFANMDMVGHTGIIDAAIKACETVDKCASEIIIEVLKRDGTAIITADHGNAEKMALDDNSPCTAHSVNPVPFVLIDETRKNIKLKPGRLADIAPTIFDIMGIDKPDEMTGEALIQI